MAHSSHTNGPSEPSGNKSDTYRLGWGDVTTEAEKIATARGIFLHVAGELYPAMGEELRTIAASLPEELPTDPGYLEREALALVEQWCTTWKLAQKGKPVDWALMAALESIAQWRAGGEWLWCLPWGAAVPNRPDGDYDPTIRRLVVEKRRRARGERKAMSAAVDEYLSAGYIKTPQRSQPEHFRWAAIHQIEGLACSQIYARSAVPISDPIRGATYVRTKVLPILRLIGLSNPRPPGRPKAARQPAR